MDIEETTYFAGFTFSHYMNQKSCKIPEESFSVVKGFVFAIFSTFSKQFFGIDKGNYSKPCYDLLLKPITQ